MNDGRHQTRLIVIPILFGVFTLLLLSACNDQGGGARDPIVREFVEREPLAGTTNLYDAGITCGNVPAAGRDDCFQELGIDQEAWQALDSSFSECLRSLAADTLTPFDEKKAFCLIGFEDEKATREATAFDEEAAEVAQGIAEGSLTLTNATAAPRDCWRVRMTDDSINITCFYEVRAQASWQTDVSPAYIHCQGWNATLAPDGGTTSYEVQGKEGSLEIRVIANPGGQEFRDRDPKDWQPDDAPPPDWDRQIPFECILSSDPEGYLYSAEFGFFRPADVDSRLAQARCDQPLSGSASPDRACAPNSDIAAALQAPWVEATKADIGAE